jgi:hypothetical protein
VKTCCDKIADLVERARLRCDCVRLGEVRWLSEGVLYAGDTGWARRSIVLEAMLSRSEV